MNRSILTADYLYKTAPILVALGLASGCIVNSSTGGKDPDDRTPVDAKPTTGDTMAEVLYVAHEGRLTSYDVATGQERPGEVQDVAGPTDLQALADGTLLVNLTDRNEILIVNGKTMLETSRIPSSDKGATRPVHSYLSPTRNGKSYWLSLNDGQDNKLETNSACAPASSPR